MRSTTQPTVVDSVVRVLGEDIVHGTHLPGDRLPDSRVATRLRVSRSTVREAMQVLAGRGMVTLVPGRSARVAGLTYDDAVALYELRAVVEPLLVERFTDRASPAQVATLDRVMGEFTETARTSDDLRRIYRARDLFYETLIAGAGGGPLAHTVRTEHGRLTAFRRNLLPPEVELRRARASARRLRLVLPAIARREGRAAARFCERAMVEDAAQTLRLIGAARP